MLTILVTSGDPDGVRVVEKSNWLGQGIVFARSDLAAAVDGGISSPGIYVLLGDDPDEEFDGLIYVGQGENVGSRLRQHQGDDAKEFWTDTVVFVSKDSGLNRAHILHLEARLLGLADEAKRVRVANGNRPSPPSLSATARAEAEGFLFEMLAIFPVLGVSAFDKPGASSWSSQRRYYLTGPDARGEGEERSDGFLVFDGATARIAETGSLSPTSSRMRSRLVATGALVEDDGVYRLVEDHLFRSPSTAAMALLSRNANGRVEWKDTESVTLKEHQLADAGEVVEGESDE